MIALTVNVNLPAGTPLTLNQLVQTDLATRTYPTQAQKDMDIARWQNAICGVGEIIPAAAAKLLVPWRNVTNGVVDAGFVAADCNEGADITPSAPAVLGPCELGSVVLYSAAGGAVSLVLQMDSFAFSGQVMASAGSGGGSGGGITNGAGNNVIPKSNGTNLVASSLSDDGSVVTSSSRLLVTVNGASAAPALLLTGTWIVLTGTTNNKPQLLIEPAGATSTNWSNSGTGLGINAGFSAFSGNLIDLQVNGTSQARITSAGQIVFNSGLLSSGGLLNFGGLTGSFPALRNSGAELQAVKADVSTVCNFRASSVFGETGVYIGANATASSFIALMSTGGLIGGTAYAYGWSSITGLGNHSTYDTNLTRNAAGVVQIGTTAANALGTLMAKAITHGANTFANLPAAPVEGMVAAVTDSTVNTFGTAIAGGGANHVLAYYNGTAWKCIGA